MTEWQGAVLLAQLERFPEQHALRNANAIALGEALAQVPGLRAQKRDERMDSQGNYCFVVHYDSSEFAGMPLRRFEEALYADGVPLGVSYPVALRPGRVPQSQLRSHAASLGSVARLREPPPARGRARRRLDRLDGAPAAAGRARPRPTGRARPLPASTSTRPPSWRSCRSAPRRDGTARGARLWLGRRHAHTRRRDGRPHRRRRRQPPARIGRALRVRARHRAGHDGLARARECARHRRRGRLHAQRAARRAVDRRARGR